MATKKKPAKKTVKKTKAAPKATPRKKATPKAKPTKAETPFLVEPPVSVRFLGNHRQRLEQASAKYDIPVGKLIRQITLKYLPVEYPVAA